jgi:opacity protein-like surface antigen
MSKHFHAVLLFMAFSMLPFFSHAQNTQQEIGVRISNFNITNLYPSFIYKKQIGENLYKRYNFGLANVDFGHNSTFSRASLSTSLSIGKEKRRDIGKRLKFIHGLQYLGGLGFSYTDNLSNNTTTNNASKQTIVNANFGLGYLLGVQFELSPTFYVNLETMPVANASYQYEGINRPNTAKITNNLWKLHGDFSNAIAINVVYCFSKK